MNIIETESEEIRMTKYFVIVNRKYLVKVEATSNGGAEHVILDNIYGTESSLAFGLDEMHIDTYKWAFEECETISYDELMKKGNNLLAAHHEAHNERINEKWEIEKEIKKIKDTLAAAEEALNEAVQEVKRFEIKYPAVGTDYTPKEKIEALKTA
jgi:hypothetical protein